MIKKILTGIGAGVLIALCITLVLVLTAVSQAIIGSFATFMVSCVIIGIALTWPDKEELVEDKSN